MLFDLLLITRPLAEAQQLALQLADLPLKMVIQPAHEFKAATINSVKLERLQQSVTAKPSPLLVFTSPRAVQFALLQLPAELLAACQLAAIGPASAVALQAAGLESVIQASSGYTSEDLLQRLDETPLKADKAWIVAAAGGRSSRVEAAVLAVEARAAAAAAR